MALIPPADFPKRLGELREMKVRSVSNRNEGRLNSFRDSFRRGRVLQKLVKDEGSISLLVIGLFLLVLMLSMTILDVAGNFLAKQELTQIGESAISYAVHSIDLDRYYRADRFFVKDGPRGPIYRIPIDCSQALLKFQTEIDRQNLRGNQIILTSWNCYQDALAAQIQSDVPLFIPIPFSQSTINANGEKSSESSRISTTVKAESVGVGAD